jgi:hypothetical protein
LLHAIANGHNDGMVALTLLGALGYFLSPSLFYLQKRWATLPMLTLSIFTKYLPVLTTPFFCVAFLKEKRWKDLILGNFVSFGVVLVLAWPYIQDGQPWPWQAMLDNAGISQHSLSSMIYRIFFYSGKLVPSFQALLPFIKNAIKLVSLGGFALFYGWLGVCFLRNRTLTGKNIDEKNRLSYFVWVITFVLVVFVVFVSAKFNAWYLGMFFPLVLLLEEGTWLRRFVMVLGAFQMLAFTPLENLHVGNYLILTLVPLLISLKEHQFKWVNVGSDEKSV